MRIHTNRLTAGDIYAAANFAAGAHVEYVREHGSRTRVRAYDFYVTGNSPFRPAFGKETIGEYAATWDQWGLLLGHLFSIDPDAHTGRTGYRSSADFHYKTGHRFVPGFIRPDQTHRRHKWQPNYDSTAMCDCGAMMRWDAMNREPIPRRIPTAAWLAHMARTAGAA